MKDYSLREIAEHIGDHCNFHFQAFLIMHGHDVEWYPTFYFTPKEEKKYFVKHSSSFGKYHTHEPYIAVAEWKDGNWECGVDRAKIYAYYPVDGEDL